MGSFWGDRLMALTFIILVSFIMAKCTAHEVDQKRKEVCVMGKKTFIYKGNEYRCGGFK